MKLSVIRVLYLSCLLLGATACDSSKEPEPVPAPTPEAAAMSEPEKPVSTSADTPAPKDGDTVIIPQEIQPPTQTQAAPEESAEPEKPAKPVVPSFTQQAISDNSLYLRFLATGESFYTEITLENGILSYTYFIDEQKRCEKWVKSTPCWQESDLKTISLALPEEDLDNLYTVAKESGIFKIKPDKVGGAKQGQRYYAQNLEVRIDGKEKKLTYQSFPGSSKKPEAFHRLETALVEYARSLPH
ncbi:MAG: hypothetical protein KJ914_03735 [Gammaproteobacteria bacterium]|nr:hypothetical protein [Gammaproteobacteria bacterium]MBU1722648.1 hypothetical protein [Gammaproteobacteria bacterium]MBU2006695.1 hypothetical protein [Gammaproteobacteria bacterium]